MKNSSYFLLIGFLLLLPMIVSSACTCDKDSNDQINKAQALKYKLIAFATILIASVIGIALPSLGKFYPAISPEKDVFYVIKAFSAGVIFSTGMVHVLPDSFDSLTNPCLPENPWGKFPFAGFIAMIAAIVSLMIDSFATGYFNKLNSKKNNNIIIGIEDGNTQNVVEHEGHMHAATHGHSHGLVGLQIDDQSVAAATLLRHRVISQVLELGIVVHSVIIGISVGASQNPSTIRPLIAALCFHQLFEGMGLGGCISQAQFKMKGTIIMAIFFALTTPLGIVIGIGISSIYDQNSPTSLIVDGIFNAASAGILIYTTLVDLLAADFMSPKLQNNTRLQLSAYLFLLLGSASMSIMAKWA